MDILGTGNFGKSLQELCEQRDKDKRELNVLFDRFTRDFVLPSSPILEPIDPESDYGKLIIGSRLQLPKGSKIQPMLKVQMAQAQYRRVEQNELITIRHFETGKKRSGKPADQRFYLE